MERKFNKLLTGSLLSVLVLLSVFVFSPLAQSEDPIATAVAKTVAVFISPTPTVSVKDMEIDIFAYQTIEAYFTGTPTPLPRPENVETAIAGTLEAMQPTATYTGEDREIATAVHETVMAFLPTATPTPSELEPLRQTIAAFELRMTATAAQRDPRLDEQAKLDATVAALNATLSAMQQQPAVTVIAPQSAVTVVAPVYNPPVYNPPISQPPAQSIPCNQYSHVQDLSIPDGSEMNPGERFTKSWRIQNTGSCTWHPGYYLALFKGTQMGTDRVNIDRTVPPGGTIDLSIKMTSPTASGSYRGNYTMHTPEGVRFLTASGSQDGIWVDIRVRETGSVPPPEPPSGPETWSVHISHDLNGGNWGAVSISPHTVTAPINQSMPADALAQERSVEPLKPSAVFKGWTVRFTDLNGNLIYDSNPDVWNLNNPFNYYASNPREMRCVMTAQWEGGAPPPPESAADTWRVYIELDKMYGYWPWENAGIPAPDEFQNLYYQGLSAPIWTSIPVNMIKAFEPTKPNAEFKGWAVRFTNRETGQEIWDSGSDVWNLDNPFNYYPDNPREMDCYMWAVWEGGSSSSESGSGFWSVNVHHDLNGGEWSDAGVIHSGKISAPIGESMPYDSLFAERAIQPVRHGYTFRGWSVRFTDPANGSVIYDSGNDTWDLEQPFDYYRDNPEEMDCMMTALWSPDELSADTWRVNVSHDLNGGKQSSGTTGWLSGRVNLTIIGPFSKSAPIGEGIWVKDAIDHIDLFRAGSIFRGWSVRFTDTSNGNLIYDSYPDVWNFDNPFDYYPENPREMDCLLTAQWLDNPFDGHNDIFDIYGW